MDGLQTTQPTSGGGVTAVFRKTAVQIVSISPTPSNGRPDLQFLGKPAIWVSLLFIKAGNLEKSASQPRHVVKLYRNQGML